jgi:hypothetical protein
VTPTSVVASPGFASAFAVSVLVFCAATYAVRRISHLRSEVRYLNSLLEGLSYGRGGPGAVYGTDEVSDSDIPTESAGVVD